MSKFTYNGGDNSVSARKCVKVIGKSLLVQKHCAFIDNSCMQQRSGLELNAARDVKERS